MIEEWKVIKQTRSSVWEISNYGNMRRNGEPYYPETEHLKGKRTLRQRCCLGRIHRLVWEAFVGEIPKGLEIDHIDTDGTNNRLDNLRLVTHKENMNNPLSRQHSSEAKQKEKHPNWGKSRPEHSIKMKNIMKGRKRVYNEDGTYKYIKVA